MYDVIIIGGGPAGLTAGLYCLRAGLKTLILEANSIGGQIASSPKVENYPGFASVSGMDLSNSFYEQVISLGGNVEFETALNIKPGDIKEVTTDFGVYKAPVVIVATGAKHRTLNLAGEEEFVGHGVSYCATCDGAFYKDKVVAVIGGANTAVTSALYLSNVCEKVYLIYRGNNLRAEKALVDKLPTKANIEVLYNSNVVELLGDSKLDGILIDKNGTKEKLNIDGLFISIGMDAEVELVRDIVDLTDNSYVKSIDCKTKEDGIFVAGDVVNKTIRQLTTAVSDGTIAASYAIEYLNKRKTIENEAQ